MPLAQHVAQLMFHRLVILGRTDVSLLVRLTRGIGTLRSGQPSLPYMRKGCYGPPDSAHPRRSQSSGFLSARRRDCVAYDIRPNSGFASKASCLTVPHRTVASVASSRTSVNFFLIPNHIRSLIRKTSHRLLLHPKQSSLSLLTDGTHLALVPSLACCFSFPSVCAFELVSLPS